VPLSRGAASPFHAMSPGPYLPPHHVASSFIQSFGHNRHGPKIGDCGAHLGGAGPPCNTMSPGPTSTSLSSGILMHPAVWPQQTSAKNWAGGRAPLGGRSPSNTMWQGPRPSSIQSAILIHVAVWPQQTSAENWGGTGVPLLRGSWVLM